MRNLVKKTGLFILCLIVVCLVAVTPVMVHALIVNLGGGNWEVTTDPPNPATGTINANGGNSVTVHEGAGLNSNPGQDAINAGTNGYTILNNGDIDADDEGIEADNFNTITNNGTIIGGSGTAVFLGRAGNQVILGSGSTTRGNIEVDPGGGANTVELNGSGTYGDQFVDNSGANMTVQKTGAGAWALTNNNITPVNALASLEINQGTLRVDGTLRTTDYIQAPGATPSA